MGLGSSRPLWQKQISVIERPFFAKFKKHQCAQCEKDLNLTKVTHYQIKKDTPESLGKSMLRFDIFNNPVDYTFYIFQCVKCYNKLSINDQYFIEKPQKKNKIKYDNYHQYLQSLDRQNNTNEYQQYLQCILEQKSKKTI